MTDASTGVLRLTLVEMREGGDPTFTVHDLASFREDFGLEHDAWFAETATRGIPVTETIDGTVTVWVSTKGPDESPRKMQRRSASAEHSVALLR